jgi:ethanolamine utilization protein EutQ (cupin superfamily)
MSLRKVSKNDVVLTEVQDLPWKGAKVAEVFPSSGTTRMSCGIHEIFASETIIEKAPVDDVLFILEGEIEIDTDNESYKYAAGDFAYLHAEVKQRFIVKDRVKLVYVTYPCNWINPS